MDVRFASPVKANVRIRTVRSMDREAWVRLRSELWPHHPLPDLAREVESYLRGDGLWRLGDRSIPFTAFVAEDPDLGIVGFVEASLRPWAEKCRTTPVGYLEGWYVAPASRRRGIGRSLVGAAEEWARERGCQEMASDAHVDNLASEKSHRALGYEEVQRLIHFRRPL